MGFFQKFLKINPIHHCSRHTVEGPSITERIVRTIRTLLGKPVFEKTKAAGKRELQSITKTIRTPCTTASEGPPWNHPCISCDFNVNKTKSEHTKIQQKKTHFTNRMKVAEGKIMCISTEVYEVYDADGIEKFSVCLTTFRGKYIKTQKEFFKKCKNMHLDFAQNCFSFSAKRIDRNGHNRERAKYWTAICGKNYEINN